jgi:hypothetical protein
MGHSAWCLDALSAWSCSPHRALHSLATPASRSNSGSWCSARHASTACYLTSCHRVPRHGKRVARRSGFPPCTPHNAAPSIQGRPGLDCCEEQTKRPAPIPATLRLEKKECTFLYRILAGDIGATRGTYPFSAYALPPEYSGDALLCLNRRVMKHRRSRRVWCKDDTGGIPTVSSLGTVRHLTPLTHPPDFLRREGGKTCFDARASGSAAA